jgi:predicted Zn-dependent protease
MEGWLSELDIEALRERWQAERSPGLALRLADEYRRRDEPASALAVLEASLETNPEHVAARVAKGRCHLDLDQAEAARAELHRVVHVDPSHLVANRLLVAANARLGDAGRARDRLDFFAFLSGDAAEVGELERLLADANREPFVLPPSDGAGELEMDTVGPAFPGRSGSGARTVRVEVRSSADPFPALELDAASYQAALFGEGVFAPVAGGASASGRGAVNEGEPGLAGAERAAPTLTLAELYRKQGHVEEAAGIFREILERQPGNLEAARALVEMQKEQSWPLSAEDLLGGAGDPNPSVGRTAGRLLQRYRERLRGER